MFSGINNFRAARCPCGYGDYVPNGQNTCTCRGLRNHVAFPPAHLLSPDDSEPDDTYFDCRNGVMKPVRNWCLVGEIVEAFHFMRPRLVVRTRFGEELPVAYHHATGAQPVTFAWADLRPGSTVLLPFVELHHFLDDTEGVRLEDLMTTFVIPARQVAVLAASDKLAAAAAAAAPAPRHPAAAAARCWHCGKADGKQGGAAECRPPAGDDLQSSSRPPPAAEPATVRLRACTKCFLAKYCSRECQAADWGPVGQHKQLCKHLAMIQAVIGWAEGPFQRWKLWGGLSAANIYA